MKSAYERALEKMNAEGSEVRSLSDEEKQKVSEIDSKYDAKIAEISLDYEPKIAAADYLNTDVLRAEKAQEIQRLEEKRDAEKEALWADKDR